MAQDVMRTDEELMAIADRRVANGMDHEAGLTPQERSTVEAFRRTRRMVQEAYADELSEPADPALEAMILSGEGRATRSTARVAQFEQCAAKGRVIAMSQRAADRPWPSTSWRSWVAMAASIAAIAAFISLSWLWSPTGPRVDVAQQLQRPGEIAADSVLAGVLEHRVSGDIVDFNTTTTSAFGRVVIAGSFRAPDGRVCREIEVLGEDLAARAVGIACRATPAGAPTQTARWQLEGAVDVANARNPDGRSPQEGGGTDFTPARSPDGDPLHAVRQRLGAAASINPDAERELIQNGWR